MEEIPVTEVRRVVIQYKIEAPVGGALDPSQRFEQDLVERVRRELIRTGSRNTDIFGGLA